LEFGICFLWDFLKVIMSNNYKIILFDGVCNLCNDAVTYIIKRDKKNVFKFAALQSEIGQELTSKFNIDTSKVDSIILIDGEKHYEKSSAALRIAKYLSGAYPLLFGFMVVPKFIRNAVYDYIAKNRYKWFGKKESCMIPTAELKSKFL
jgi:predicted DCC family thiol-disulfide oxidoreductase YuxK